MGSAVLLTFEVEARNVAEDVEPGGRVATNLDLRLDGPKRVERLVEQIAHNAGLWRVARRTHIVDRQVIVNPKMALDKAGHLPLLRGPVEALEHQDVAAAGGAAIAFATPLPIGMGERSVDSVTQGRGVARLSRTDAVGQTSFFHGAPCRTAYSASVGAYKRGSLASGKGAPG
jgi:hypothetical protein